MIHRSYANQQSDYQFIAEQLRWTGEAPRKIYGKTKLDVASVAETIIDSLPGLSYFALHKLFYLVELDYVKQHGEQLTRAFFIRQKDGPYCVDLHLKKLQRALPCLELHSKHGLCIVHDSRRDLFGDSAELSVRITKEVKNEILQTLSKYRGLGESEMKTKVYLTTPMRRILKQEKQAGMGLYNLPIDLVEGAERP